MWSTTPREPGQATVTGNQTVANAANNVESSEVFSKTHVRPFFDAIERAEASKDELFLRQRIRELGERLIFRFPLEYGCQAENTLWKKAFYEPYARYKFKKDQFTAHHQVFLEQLLLSGLGTYHQILARLQLDFGVDLMGIVDVAFSRFDWDSFVEKKLHNFTAEQQIQLQKWAHRCAYRSLLALGDLSRYLHELKGQKDGAHREAAFRYYHQAVLTCSSQGQPFNQLGTLTSGELVGLKAVYFYFRCLLCREPFLGARNNLNLFFEENRTAVVMNGSVPGPGWENGIRVFLSMAEQLWQAETPKSSLSIFVSGLFHNEEPLRCDVQFYALLLLLALDQRLARDGTDSVENDQFAPWLVVRDLLFALGARLLRELHQRLCVHTCSKHPFNEATGNSLSSEIFENRRNKDHCLISSGQVNGSSGDSGSGSLKRFSVKPKIVRRRRVFDGGESDFDDDDDNGGQGGGDRAALATGRVVPDSDEDLPSGSPEASDGKLDGTIPKILDGEARAGSSGENSDGSMSSSSGWSSSSDEDSDSDDEASDELIDTERLSRGSSRRSQEDLSCPRGSAVKIPLPRLSPRYTLDKALSCRQLVKQVASEKLLPAAKLFLDWLLLLSTDKWRSKVSEKNKTSAVASGLPLKIIKHVTDLANLLCVVKYRVMLSSDSTIEHVRIKMGELSIESGEATRKFANGDDPVSPDNTLQSSQGRSRENEFVLPEDIHFPLGSAPALRAAEALSWTSRSNLATEGQRAVYRMHLIADRAASICANVEGAIVLKGERITFEQVLQEKIAESISRESTPTIGAGKQNARGGNNRGSNYNNKNGGGQSAERGAGDSERQQVMMKSLAHAWLRHEVEGLEEKLEASDGRNGSAVLPSDPPAGSANTDSTAVPSGRNNGAGLSGLNGTSSNANAFPAVCLSPFVVVDTSALSTRLTTVQAIAYQKKSILIVPTCVLSRLDELKKEMPQARDATRWLQTEMRKGS